MTQIGFSKTTTIWDSLSLIPRLFPCKKTGRILGTRLRLSHLTNNIRLPISNAPGDSITPLVP